ncbi:MAG: response regulator transcription factor [Elusimicrobia bacterium]|nr:response regulator transcription factor [Elusimicrobiota bacterium]
MTPRIALVEPDAGLARGLTALLKGQGYAVSRYPTLGRFFDAMRGRRPNAVLMNMQLQGMEGREILRALRANPGTRAMLLIGISENARSKDEVVAAFTAGADEYFFKPLEEDLLVVRLRSLLARKPARAEEEVFRHGRITVCPASHACTVAGRGVRLTRLEFELLLQFIRNPQRVLTRGNLIDSLWRGDVTAGGRAVDRHISALRAKLGSGGRLLETVVGAGYRLASGSSK